MRAEVTPGQDLLRKNGPLWGARVFLAALGLFAMSACASPSAASKEVVVPVPSPTPVKYGNRLGDEVFIVNNRSELANIALRCKVIAVSPFDLSVSNFAGSGGGGTRSHAVVVENGDCIPSDKRE